MIPHNFIDFHLMHNKCVSDIICTSTISTPQRKLSSLVHQISRPRDGEGSQYSQRNAAVDSPRGRTGLTFGELCLIFSDTSQRNIFGTSS